MRACVRACVWGCSLTAGQIHLYEPAILIVGTRGRSMSGFQGLLPGSVSKYCLQHSPVPVIVVRPNAKREKKKRKRQEDAGRHSYRALLELSGMQGDALLSQALDAGDGPNEATEAEAVAVAKAIGYNPSIVYDGATAAAATAAAERRRSKSPGRLLKSPEPAGTVESPSTSSRSTDTDNGGDASPGASPGSVPVESSKPAAPAAAATVPIINITNAPTPASVQDGAMSASVEAVKSPRLQDGVRRLSLLEEET